MKTITTHRIAEVLEEAGFDWEMDGADAPEVLIRVAISGITLDHIDNYLMPTCVTTAVINHRSCTHGSGSYS